MKNLSVLCGVVGFWLIASPSQAQSISERDGVEASASTGCAYTFTSGAGTKKFTWCLSGNGNVMKLETPAGQNHMLFNAEGYGVCSASGTHGADWGEIVPKPFGPATVLSGCTIGTTCTIQRDTTDGVFRLVQRFTQLSSQREINIDHTLTNLSGVTRTNVVLTRFSAFNPNNDAGDRGDTSLRTGRIRDLDAIGSTAATFLESAQTWITTFYPTGCAVTNPTTTPTVPGTWAAHVRYNLGSILPLKKKIVRVQIRAD